jgi:hypothetical protein
VDLLINRFGCKVGKVGHPRETRQNKNEQLRCNFLKAENFIIFFMLCSDMQLSSDFSNINQISKAPAISE